MFEPKCTWRALLTLGAWLLPQSALAQVGYPLETVGLDCDPAQGRVELTVDEFGAVDFVDDEDFVVAVLRSGASLTRGPAAS